MAKIRIFYHPPPILHESFRLHGIGIREEMRPCTVDRPAGTGDYLFMYYYDPVILNDPALRGKAPGGSLMIWPPGAPQLYGHPDATFAHSWMHGDGTAIAPLLHKHGIPTRRVLALADPGPVERFLAALHREATEERTPRVDIALHLLEILLIEVARFGAAPEAGHGAKDGLRAARRAMESRFAEAWTLGELAAEARLSPPHFCAAFKARFGEPPVAHLRRLRMEHGAYLLRDRNLRVAEVGKRVGVPDIYQFSRLFKKHHGVSPRAFRESLAQSG